VHDCTVKAGCVPNDMTCIQTACNAPLMACING
jgi:hypothetical protein